MTNLGRLLLVDDDNEYRLLCELIFKVRGFELRSLSHCDDLFDAVEDFSPQLILMDYQLPGMNGADAIRLIKKHDRYKTIPVLFFSGDDKLPQLAHAVNAEDYLAKPFKIAELMDKVGRLLQRKIADY